MVMVNNKVILGLFVGVVIGCALPMHGKSSSAATRACRKKIIVDEICANTIKVKNLEVCPCPTSLVHVEIPKPTVDELAVKFLFTLTIPLTEPIVIPNGPSGTRLIVGFDFGVFEGPELKGCVIAKPGGDWLTFRSDASASLDARALLKTDEGDFVYMTYQGILGAGESTDIRIAPLFQTDQFGPLAYLNNIQAVGIGKLLDGGNAVTYEIFALE